ncbi:alpha/beta hydrolase [Sedimentitalea sp. HM32M-2]|uniref:alpha/beta hydrolase n=1 Tax=Sedimentitalea sp. HM32M-2 TaxID=3351566 RepID=UPI00362B2D1E
MDLDDAYANAAHIPGGPDFPALWDMQAQAFRDVLGPWVRLGQPYGAGARQVYDLFLPQGRPRGTVIFVHGGYWRMFDRSIWSHLAAGPLARGWAVAMPGYDLCPQVSIAQITRQIAAAVQVIAGHTRGPISITGHSAGGHLAARMLAPGLLPEPVAARLATVAPISPLSDLRPLLRTSMNADFRMTLQDAEAESPLFMQDRHDATVTVWVGAEERPAFLDQARWLSECWAVEQMIVPDRHHFDVIDLLTDAKSDLVRRLTA